MADISSYQTARKIIYNETDYIRLSVPLNEKFVEDVYPYAKWSIISLIILQLILIAVSTKQLRVVKSYIYLQAIGSVITTFFPQ